MQGVRGKLAPWDKKIAAAQSRLDVATAERDLLAQQHADAQQRLSVSACSSMTDIAAGKLLIFAEICI